MAIVLLLLGCQILTPDYNDNSIDSINTLYESSKMYYECKIGVREWPDGVLDDPNKSVKECEAEMNYYEELVNNNIPMSDYFNLEEPLSNKETMRYATIGYMLLYIMAYFIMIAALSIPFVFSSNEENSVKVLGVSYAFTFLLNLIIFILGMAFVLKNSSIPVIQQFSTHVVTVKMPIFFLVKAFGIFSASMFMTLLGYFITRNKKARFIKYILTILTYAVFCTLFLLEMGLKSNNYAVIPVTHLQFACNIIPNPIYWIGAIICVIASIGYLVFISHKNKVCS